MQPVHKYFRCTLFRHFSTNLFIEINKKMFYQHCFRFALVFVPVDKVLTFTITNGPYPNINSLTRDRRPSITYVTCGPYILYK